jgi:hypothetical protein
MANEQTAGEVSMEQRPVATCGYCGREVGKQECLYTHVVIDGIEYPRIPLGDDREVAAGLSDPTAQIKTLDPHAIMEG